jgi:hypothetical protein
VDAAILKRVADFLSAHPGRAYCDDCLAAGIGIDKDVVWEAAEELSPSPEYEVDAGICSVCFTHVGDVAHVEWTTPSEESTAERAEHPKHRIKFRFSGG